MSKYIVQQDYIDPKEGLFLKKGQEVEGEFRGKTEPNVNSFVRVFFVNSQNRNTYVDLIDGIHVKVKPVNYSTNNSNNHNNNSFYSSFKNDVISRKFYYTSSAIIGLSSGYAFSRFYKKASQKESFKVSVICMVSAVLVMGAISLSKKNKS